MTQIEFLLVTTLLVLPSLFLSVDYFFIVTFIISIYCLISYAFSCSWNWYKKQTKTDHEPSAVGAYAFSIAPFPFLPPPPFHLYLFIQLLSWSTTSCYILVKLLSIHSVERIACIFCHILFLHKFDLQNLYKHSEWTGKSLPYTSTVQAPRYQLQK